MNIPLPVILSVAKDPIVRPAEDIELDSSLARPMNSSGCLAKGAKERKDCLRFLRGLREKNPRLGRFIAPSAKIHAFFPESG